MVAEPIPYRVTKMPLKRKGFQAAQKEKGQSGNPMFRANKAASDAAFASTGVNPVPMGRPWPTKEGAAAPELLSPPHSSEKRAADMAMGKDARLVPGHLKCSSFLLTCFLNVSS